MQPQDLRTKHEGKAVGLEQNGECVIKWRPEYKLPNLASFSYPLSAKGSIVCLYHSCHGQQNWVKSRVCLVNVTCFLFFYSLAAQKQFSFSLKEYLHSENYSWLPSYSQAAHYKHSLFKYLVNFD